MQLKTAAMSGAQLALRARISAAIALVTCLAKPASGLSSHCRNDRGD